MFKTRRNKIKGVLEYKFTNKLSDTDINELIEVFYIYEKDNIDTIEKLKREKVLETKRISGALKMCINAHGPITKQFLGSATKRVYGALLSNEKKENIFIRVFKKLWKK